MTERADPGSAAGGWHLQVSKLLVGCVIAATAATGALLVAVVFAMPGRGPGPGPDGLPPPPPDLRPLAVFSVLTGLFVLGWLAVLVVAARDQILRRLRDLPPSDELLAQVRAELHLVEERLTEYGERRETDGYLSGMRVAAAEPNVRSLRRQPPPR